MEYRAEISSVEPMPAQLKKWYNNIIRKEMLKMYDERTGWVVRGEPLRSLIYVASPVTCMPEDKVEKVRKLAVELERSGFLVWCPLSIYQEAVMLPELLVAANIWALQRTQVMVATLFPDVLTIGTPIEIAEAAVHSIPTVLWLPGWEADFLTIEYLDQQYPSWTVAQITDPDPDGTVLTLVKELIEELAFPSSQ